MGTRCSTIELWTRTTCYYWALLGASTWISIALPLSYGPVLVIFKRLDFGSQIVVPLSYGPALLSFSGHFLGTNLDIYCFTTELWTSFGYYYWTLFKYQNGYSMLYHRAMDPYWLCLAIDLSVSIRIPNCSTTELWTCTSCYYWTRFKCQSGYSLLYH